MTLWIIMLIWYVSTFRSVEPQWTANNRTKLNSASAQTPASAHAPASAQIPTHAPAPQLPPSHPALVDIPFQTEQGEESEGRGSDSAGGSASTNYNSASAGYNSASAGYDSASASAGYDSAGDSEHITGQHLAPLTEQLQSRSVEKLFLLSFQFFSVDIIQRDWKSVWKCVGSNWPFTNLDKNTKYARNHLKTDWQINVQTWGFEQLWAESIILTFKFLINAHLQAWADRARGSTGNVPKPSTNISHKLCITKHHATNITHHATLISFLIILTNTTFHF